MKKIVYFISKDCLTLRETLPKMGFKVRPNNSFSKYNDTDTLILKGEDFIIEEIRKKAEARFQSSDLTFLKGLGKRSKKYILAHSMNDLRKILA